MLELRVNNKPIDIFPGTKVPLQFYSPIFDRDSIQRSFSFPFKVPATLRNKKLFEYPSRIDGAGRRKYDLSELRLAGHQFEQGTIVITSSENDQFEIAFKNAELELIENLNNYRIRKDLKIPVDAVNPFRPTILLRLGLETRLNDESLAAIEINRKIYTVLARFPQSIADDINADIPGLVTVTDYTFQVLDLLFSTNADPDVKINTSPSLQNPQEYIYFDLIRPDNTQEEIHVSDYKIHVEDVQNGTYDTHRFPVIYAPNFYDKENESFLGYVNYHDESSQLHLPLRDTEQQAENTLVPMPFAQEVFKKLFETAGELKVTGSFFSDSALANLLIYNNRSIERAFSISDYIIDLNETVFILYKETYHLQDHLPDLTFYEFVRAFGTTLPIVYRLQGNTIRVDLVNSLITKNSIDLSSYTLEAWKKQYTKYSGFSLTYNRQETPEESDQYLQDLDGGTNEDQTLPLKSEFFTHYFKSKQDENTFDEDGLNARRWTVPYDPFQGDSLPSNTSSEVDLRLLFYFGNQSDSKGQNYPFASFLPENYAGEDLGTYSLEWDGEKGLYLHHWKEYINLLMADEMTMQFLLPMQKIIELKQNITTAIYVNHPDGAFRGLIKKFSFSASTTSTNQFLCKMTIAKQ